MRWIGVALAIAAAVFAFASLRAPRDETSAPGETIGDASRAELERVLRETGAGEAAQP